MKRAQSNHPFDSPKSPASYWISSTHFEDYPSLETDIETDVVIIGGGIAGITTAYMLKKEGLRIALIEAGQIALGTTGHTTAKITSQHDLIYHTLIKNWGRELAEQYAQANETAIQTIRQIAEENKIACDFSEQSAYVYTLKDQYIKQILEETQSALELGIHASYMDRITLPFKIKAAVRFDFQAQFHPLKYLLGLSKAISGNGCQIYEHTRAIGIDEGPILTIHTRNGKKITAKYAVITTHYPFINKDGFYFARIYTERSYVVAVQIKEKYPGGMYIAAEETGLSFRSQTSDTEELVFVGGESHKTGQGEDTSNHYKALQNAAQKTFDVVNIPYQWSTQDCMTIDDLPYVGYFTKDTPNIFVATGFAKWGMTNSTASASLIRDLILDRKSPFEEVYRPSRIPSITSAKNFIIENLNVAQKLIEGKLSINTNALPLEPGCGKVVTVDMQRTGAYRDDTGELHLVDTTCTHLGCELNWNTAEKSWDCPCHGSRFSYDGRIIEGPALEPLKKPDSNKLEN